MTRLLTLLNQKNHYLEKFYALNEAELNNFLNGDFDNIQAFYETREKILEMIKYIDSEVDKLHSDEIQKADPTLTLMKKRVSEALRVKNLYVEKIVRQDVEVLSCIENAKNSIIRELQELSKGKKALSGYKTKVFSPKIDEEI